MALAMAAVALETALASIYEVFCGCGDTGENFMYGDDDGVAAAVDCCDGGGCCCKRWRLLL